MRTEVCTNGLSAAISSQAHEGACGGDIYYFSVCSYDKLTRIAVADLRGHGEEASVLSSWLYNALEQRMNSLDGAGVLEELNAKVKEKGFSAITTAVVAAYYPDAGKLYVSYAGHPPMALRSSGTEWRSVPMQQAAGAANLPLGIMSEVRFDQQEVQVEPGDRFALFTDGILERMDSSGDTFGVQRLLASLGDSNDAELGAARDHVLGELNQFSGQDDDETLLLIELR